MLISEKDWNNYIDLLSQLNETAGKAMKDYILKYGLEDIEAVVDYAYGLVTKYGEGSAALAAEMYDATAELSGKVLPAAEVAETASHNEVAKAIQGTRLKSSNPNSYGSTVSRLVKQAGADTTLKNARRDGAQFAWVPSGDTCPFCIMLASNGFQPVSKKALRKGHAEHIHANCNCNYTVRFDNYSGVSGYDPDEYLKMYKDADGANYKEKINSMRRMQYQDPATREKINAQKRAAYAEKSLIKKRENDTINLAKAKDVFEYSFTEYKPYSPQEIADDLETTEIGRDVLRWIDESKVVPVLNDETPPINARAFQQGRHIELYLEKLANANEAAKATIHEMVHYRYHIGGCQHAEAICMAHEKMHVENRKYLTRDEWDKIVKLAKEYYPDYNWEEGGYGIFEQFNFVRE